MKGCLVFLACLMGGVAQSQGVTPAHNYTIPNDSTKFGIGLKTGDIILDVGQKKTYVLLQAYSDLFTLRAADNKLLLNDTVPVQDTISGVMWFVPRKDN